MTIRYTTSGSVRGSCGHRHRSLATAWQETWRQARCHINRRADRARNGRIIVELHP